MERCMQTQVRAFQPQDQDAVQQLQLAEHQSMFAMPFDQFLATTPGEFDGFIIEYDSSVVGCFMIDTTYAEKMDFCEPSGLGLRNVLIDHRMQGKGIGAQAIISLLNKMKSFYPDHSQLFLTVNCRNAGAIKCYIKAGFVDTGELYLGGDAGPQHIMKASF